MAPPRCQIVHRDADARHAHAPKRHVCSRRLEGSDLGAEGSESRVHSSGHGRPAVVLLHLEMSFYRVATTTYEMEVSEGLPTKYSISEQHQAVFRTIQLHQEG
jgi:hypothetical protein